MGDVVGRAMSDDEWRAREIRIVEAAVRYVDAVEESIEAHNAFVASDKTGFSTTARVAGKATEFTALGAELRAIQALVEAVRS